MEELLKLHQLVRDGLLLAPLMRGLLYDSTACAAATALTAGLSLDDLYQLTKIDRWFLRQLSTLVLEEERLKAFGDEMRACAGATVGSLPTAPAGQAGAPSPFCRCDSRTALTITGARGDVVPSMRPSRAWQR